MAERGSGGAAGAKASRLSADVEPFVPKQQAVGAKWPESSATLPRYLTTCYPFVQDPYVDRQHLHTPENGCNKLSQNFSELHTSYPVVSSHLPVDYSLCYSYKQSSDSSLNEYAQTPLRCDDICLSKHKYGSRGNKKKQSGQQDSEKEKSFLNQSSKEARSRKELRNQGQNVNEVPEAATGEHLQQPDVFRDNATKSQDKQSNRCQHSKSKPLQKIQNEFEPQTTITTEVALSDFPVLQSPVTKQSSCDLRNARVSSKSSEQSTKIRPSDDATDTDERMGTTQLPRFPVASEKCSVSGSTTVTASTVAPPASSLSSTATPSVLSWARIVSQAPKKPVLSSAPPKISAHNVSQSTDGETKLKEAAGKVKKKKKKKKPKESKDASEPNESRITVQELPRFEDDEEFPDLASAISSSDKANSAGQDQFFSYKQVTKRQLKPSVDEDLVLSVANSHAIGGEQISLELDQKPVQILRKESFQEYVSSSPQKKAVEVPKKSGKKSKVPIQLDFSDMLAVLEQKQQKSSKHTPKPVVLAVGGTFPLVPKETAASKRQPQSSSQEKVPHNPLDSSAPLVKRGKQREVPKAKKPTSLKKIILKEREERKQRRLLEEKGLVPSSCDMFAQALVLDQNASLDTQNGTAELNDSTEDLDDSAPSSHTQNLQSLSETPKTPEETWTESVLMNPNRPKIHSRRFREYCSQVLSKEVDNYVTDLLKELVRFQDRLYQKDPIKAKKKRRVVMGLREVLKHLKLKKLKCVIISPNCERIQSKGGLDDALHMIIEVAREQEIPFVFALNRKALGRCVNKAVPVSVVGIFSYDGAENQFHQMVELTEEARKAYQEMLNALEQELTAGEGNSTEPLCDLPEESTIALDSVTSQSFSEASEPDYGAYQILYSGLTAIKPSSQHYIDVGLSYTFEFYYMEKLAQEAV
ncbi:selenocysteine insertion sequence-binding protein 2-like isoform X2 [Carcharodon carcharias]|uniref:selenocysteine insertion sequence-binding protein 2-like isoform X2 n=1 Tax=Carcharodon carcharias TaxID=13397 RepID=UPI001B7DD9EC|nr:selenocysteine insertion sequence-binding protein 2-like isoform X2 [Carcharodon carcharias]